MSYADITRNNKSSIKKFSHQKRFDIAMDLIDLKPKETLLHFATGDGFLLQRLHEQNAEAKLYGYHPFDFMVQELQDTIKKNNLNNVFIANKRDALPISNFDVVTCLEVL